MTRLECIIGKVHAWDHKDIISLREMIAEARDIGEDMRNHVNPLPSEPIAPEYKSETFPVWSIDQSGLCIAGEDMDKLVHVSVIKYMCRQIKKVNRNV